MINKIVNKNSRINCNKIKGVENGLNSILDSDKIKKGGVAYNFQQYLKPGTVKKIKEGFSDEHI